MPLISGKVGTASRRRRRADASCSGLVRFTTRRRYFMEAGETSIYADDCFSVMQPRHAVKCRSGAQDWTPWPLAVMYWLLLLFNISRIWLERHRSIQTQPTDTRTNCVFTFQEPMGVKISRDRDLRFLGLVLNYREQNKESLSQCN